MGLNLAAEPHHGIEVGDLPGAPTGPNLGGAVRPCAPTRPGPSTAGSPKALATIAWSCVVRSQALAARPSPPVSPSFSGQTAPALATPRAALPDHRGLWARNRGLATKPKETFSNAHQLGERPQPQHQAGTKTQTLTGRHQVVVPASTTAARCGTRCPTQPVPRSGPAKNHRFAQTTATARIRQESTGKRLLSIALTATKALASGRFITKCTRKLILDRWRP